MASSLIQQLEEASAFIEQYRLRQTEIEQPEYGSFSIKDELKTRYRAILAKVFTQSAQFIEDGDSVLHLPPMAVYPNRLTYLLTIKTPDKSSISELAMLEQQNNILKTVWSTLEDAQFLLEPLDAEGGQMDILASKSITEHTLEAELILLKTLGVNPQ
jgi:hypothetical protein